MPTKELNIEKIIPYARNPRKNESAVSKVAASIQEFGFKQPIVVDKDNVVIAGHTRLLAAQQLNMKKVPVLVADDLTEAQVKAYRITDNRVGQEAEWDFDLLKLEMDDLVGLEFNLDETGFDVKEIESILHDTNQGLTDPDEIPEAPEPITKPGDVWILGNHRLVCGDSTNPETVNTCLNGVKPHLMVTDPPYGVNYDPTWRQKAGVNKNKSKMGLVENDTQADWSAAWALFPGNIVYVWHGGKESATVQHSLETSDFDIRCQIIWAKDRFALSRGDYHWQHEPCWYAVRKGTKGSWNGDRSQTTVWNIKSRDDSGHGHSTQKPIECMRRPIVNNSSPGQAVYEPFCGSGTTIIAGEMEGRHIYAIELSPEYCDIAVKRWENFTGKKAEIQKQEAA